MSRKRRRRRGRATVRAIAMPIAIAIALAIVAAPRMALAASYGLSWSPAPGQPPCVEQRALEDAVAQRLGRAPFVALADADVVLEGRELAPRSGRPRARLEQHARDGRVLGSRDLEAAGCAELARATAFVIVLIVDPDALLREPTQAPPPVTPDARLPPASEPPRAVAVAPRPSPTPRRRPHAPPIVSAGAALTFATGLLPGGDIGGAVLLGVSPWRFPVSFEWRGSYHASLASPRGRGFTAFEQEWRACYLFGARAVLGASACLGGAWAAIFPKADGLHEGDQAPKGVLGPLLALGPTLRFGDYAAVADVSVFFPQPRYLFSYLDDAGQRRTLHELDRFVVSATIGVTRAF